MRARERWAVALMLLVAFIVPLWIANGYGAPGRVHVARSMPPRLIDAIARGTGLSAAAGDDRRLAETISQPDGAALMAEPSARAITRTGLPLGLTRLFTSRTVLLLPPGANAHALADLATTRRPLLIASGEEGRSLAAFDAALGGGDEDEAALVERLADRARGRSIELLDFAEMNERVGQDVPSQRLLAASDAPILVVPGEWVPALLLTDPRLGLVVPDDTRAVDIVLASRNEPRDIDRRSINAYLDSYETQAGADIFARIRDSEPTFTASGLRASQSAAHAIRSGTAPGPDGIDMMLVHTLVALVIIAWGVSIYWRVLHPPVRRLLLLTVFLLFVWATLRLLKLAAPAVAEPALWLAYYIPMLGLPSILFHMSLVLDDAVPDRIMRRASTVVGVVSAFLLALALSTRRHGLILAIPEGFSSGDPYSYGPAHAVVMAWIGLLALASWLLLAHSAGARRAWGALGVILVVLIVLAAFVVAYRMGARSQLLSEPTALVVLAVVIMSEAALHMGSIATARSYRQAFSSAAVPAMVVDEHSRVLAISAGEAAWRAEGGAARRGSGSRSRPIPGGALVWRVDNGQVATLRRELTATRTLLRSTRDSLARASDLQIPREELARRTRVLNALDVLSGPSIARASSDGRALVAAAPGPRARTLRGIAVDLSYVKHMGRLLLDSTPTVPLGARTAGAGCDYGWVRADDLMRALSLFFTDFTSATHMCVLVHRAAPDEWVCARIALSTMTTLHRALRAASSADGAEVLVHAEWREDGVRLSMSAEFEGETPTGDAESMGLPGTLILEDDGGIHLRALIDSAVRLDPEGLTC